MDEKTAFYENCRKEVLYTTKKRLGKFVLKSGSIELVFSDSVK